MAAAVLAPAPGVTDIASLLTPEEIPVKLRCTICNKLAVNAVKLPCCDQSICEACHARLPASCPVCEHTPISADDCKPNKALRTTIRVYLRTAEKKREQAKENARNEKVSEASSISAPEPKQEQTGLGPLSAAPENGLAGKSKELAAGKQKTNGTNGQETQDSQQAQPASVPATEVSIATFSIPQFVGHFEADKRELAQTEVHPARAESTLPKRESDATQSHAGGAAGGDGALVGETVGPAGDGQIGDTGTDLGQAPSFLGGSMGADITPAGYSNTSWNAQAGFNPMMQTMQNSFASGQWNTFPNMMGMSAMNMDPMTTSQGMFGGFGGHAMGMNGMNGMSMNMGMGVGAHGGQGGYNGWNGSNAWNVGQEKFHPMAGAGNVGNGLGGSYGANTAGFDHPHPAAGAAAGGYNLQSTHGNYSQMSQNQLYHQTHDVHAGFRGGANHGYLPRGPRGAAWRGRGFGPPGRAFSGGGAYGQDYAGNHEPFHHQLPQRLPHTTTDARHGRGGDASASGLDGSTDAKALAGGDPGPAANGPDVNADAERPGEARLSRDQRTGEPANDATATHQVGADGSTHGHPYGGTDMAENAPDGAHASAAHHAENTEAMQATAPGTTGKPGLATPDTKVINAPLGPAALMQGDQSYLGRGRGLSRGIPRGPGFRGGRGAVTYWPNINGVVPPSGPAAERADAPVGKGVEGAPTAPKALREGLPNTGIRGRGFPVVGKRGTSATGTGAHGTAASTRSKSKSPDRRSRSRSPDDRSPQVDRRQPRRSRSRERDVSEPDSERARRREQRRRRHSRRHDSADDDGRGAPGKRSREQSADTTASRSPNRSRRERERRDALRHRGSHWSRPERDRDRDRDRERERERERERSRERRRRRRRSRSPSSIRANDEGKTTTQRRVSDVREIAPVGPTNGRRRSSRERLGKYRDRERDREGERRSRRDRSRSASDNERYGRRGRHDEREKEKGRDGRSQTITTSAAADHHTREREERNRERLLKEQQRRQELNRERERKDRERKRDRDPDDDEGEADAAGGAADRTTGAGGQETRSSKRRRHRRRRADSHVDPPRATGGADGGVSAGAGTGTGTGTGVGADKASAVGGRRMSYKYEGDESDEARAARIEKEREAQRWE